jgi:hypothetical protein
LLQGDESNIEIESHANFSKFQYINGVPAEAHGSLLEWVPWKQ